MKKQVNFKLAITLMDPWILLQLTTVKPLTLDIYPEGKEDI